MYRFLGLVSMATIQSVQKKIHDFLALEPGMSVAVVSDNDEDGITAAVQMRLYLELNGCVVNNLLYNHII